MVTKAKTVKVKANGIDDVTTTFCPTIGGTMNNGICQLHPDFADKKKVYGGFLGLGRDKALSMQWNAFVAKTDEWKLEKDETTSTCRLIQRPTGVNPQVVQVSCDWFANYCKISPTESTSGNVHTCSK